MNTSEGPVRYFNGEVRIEVVDVESSGFGTPWSHTRTYSNQQKVDFDRGNGWNWNPVNLPYLAQSSLWGSSLTLYSNLYNLRYFNQVSNSNFYRSDFGDLSSLVRNASSQKFQLIDLDGTEWLFNDFSHATRPGGFVSVKSPGGTALTVVQESGDRIIELRRNVTIGSDTSSESFLYDYITSGPLDGHFLSCTSRKRASSSDPWSNVTRAVYSYYENDDGFGSLGDLRTATRQVWDGTNWIDTATDYYRYYLSGDANGSAHDLKFVCGPEAFSRLSESVSDPFTASDAEVALYADYYYEYDGNDRVKLERIYAGSKTIQFSYERNPHSPLSSSSSSVGTTDYNFWVYKTTETQPDESQRITYANYAGQTMLSVLKTSDVSTDEWCTFFRYDSAGRQMWIAQPSAVTGYNEAYDDLLRYLPGSGKYQYLRDNEGMIQVTEYYTSSSSSGSGVSPEGYVKSEKIMRGQLGSPVLLRSFEYTSHTDGTTTIYPVSKQTQYPSDTSASGQIATSFVYTFHSGTTQIAQQTTVLPAISSTQNGSGTANQRKEYFDTLGYRTWSMDERGFITRYVYDPVNGALVQQIEDVDTSIVSGAPSGWNTPSGGGLNLVTDYESDDQGRITQELGPSHQIDLSGTATTIRRASWTVYDDADHIVRVGQGYATGTGPSYTYTLINPVQIRQMDRSNKLIAEITATRSSTSGKLLPSDAFPQSSYVRWTTYQYTDCCLLESQRVYRLIPSSGIGIPGTNYDETLYGYDYNKRRNRVVTPGGTITFSVFNSRNLPISIYVGTNDTGATPSDPTGGGAVGNNMVLVTGNQYDDGSPGGDSNLTQVTQSVDSTASRVTQGEYDWRNRLTVVDGEIDYYAVGFYDNLDRITKVERRNSSSTGNLIAREETKYDNLSRVYQTLRYSVDPATGVVGNGLTNNTWYDQVGNVVKSLIPGSNVWTKTAFDSLNRPTIVYSGYGADSTYSDIFSVTGDVVLQQIETLYDNASNAIQSIDRQRYQNAPTSQTGPLGSPTLTPNARIAYTAMYPDALGRRQAIANYGTNGGTALIRSATIPSRSNDILVNSETFDAVGNLFETVDPAGIVTRFGYDAAGRRTQVIENYSSNPPSSSSSSGTCAPSADVNRTTNLSYSPDGQVQTLAALNAATGTQVTTYTYGTTLSNSEIASSVLLRSIEYPDATATSDVVSLSYNRQGQRTSLSDQNGSVHRYDYDLLGRLTQDRVTVLAAQVDGAVRRLETAYDVRGLVQRVTSHSSATVGSGSTVNEVRFTYNSFGQSIRTYQAHAGGVDVMTTPSVQMGYANGSANTVRQTSLSYPNGRELTYNYLTGNSIYNQTSRVAHLVDSDAASTHLAEYAYLGSGEVVLQTSPQPNIRYGLVSGTTPDPITGDIYGRMDRFGRIKISQWRNLTTSVTISNVQYGYDRDSNRTWRKNVSDPGRHYDWKYAYDGLQRLKDGQRGTLNSTNTTITNPQFGQCWTLDATGNWSGFKQSDTGTTWSLEQTRASNAVNEITQVSATVGPQWATPVYDANGNMTSIPSPDSPRPSWSDLTPDQWSALTVNQWSGLEVAPTMRATYDAWNRLVKLADGGSGQTIQEDEYDARGYRVVTKSYAEGSLAETRHAYYTDQWQVVEERLGTSSTPERQFVWGVRYIDDLLLRDRSTSGTLDERLYACQDANWNVTTVVDAAGAVVERYEYDPYGNTTVLSPTFAVRATSSVGWETTYCGYRWDQTSGLFAVRHRFYAPKLGVWVTRDPAEYVDGMSLYGYVSGMPLGHTDPSGQSFWPSFGRGLISGVIGGLVVAAAAIGLVTVGVPGAVVTTGFLVAGTLSAGFAIGTLLNNPTADNVGFTAGAFTGGAIVGGCSGRMLATRTSSSGNQPAPGWKGFDPRRDASQVWRWNTRESFCRQFRNAMDSGPNPLSAAGSVTAIGGGIPASVNNVSK